MNFRNSKYTLKKAPNVLQQQPAMPQLWACSTTAHNNTSRHTAAVSPSFVNNYFVTPRRANTNSKAQSLKYSFVQ